MSIIITEKTVWRLPMNGGVYLSAARSHIIISSYLRYYTDYRVLSGM